MNNSDIFIFYQKNFFLLILHIIFHLSLCLNLKNLYDITNFLIISLNLTVQHKIIFANANLGSLFVEIPTNDRKSLFSIITKK